MIDPDEIIREWLNANPQQDDLPIDGEESYDWLPEPEYIEEEEDF